MDCSGITVRRDKSMDTRLDKILSNQDKLYTKFAKLEIRQEQLDSRMQEQRRTRFKQDSRQSRGKSSTRESSSHRGKDSQSYKGKGKSRSDQDRPPGEKRCYICDSPKHLKRDCPRKTPDKQQDSRRQDKSCCSGKSTKFSKNC